VIRRILAFLLVGWALGFAAFVIFLPRPAGTVITDGIVVPTGGPGRIARGSELIERRLAKRMLISGVERTVRPVELAEKQEVPLIVLACCVDLGRTASDTRSNAAETAAWVKLHRYRSIRLVTSDWHMPRARFELQRVLPDSVVIVPDALRSDATLLVLFREYNKYLLRRFAVLVGVWR
jgi:uncharacterized SAM-binding protein YcdF (DUF218 family)